MNSFFFNEDRIFEASDELHYIHLFKKDKKFEILYNGVNTAEGKFEIYGDSIFLDYDKDEIIKISNSESVHANEVLTTILLIKGKRIKSVDDKSLFCADIVKNELQN